MRSSLQAARTGWCFRCEHNLCPNSAQRAEAVGWSTSSGVTRVSQARKRRRCAAGRTLLGLNRRYFGVLEQFDPALAPFLESTRLPSWACLDCRPKWFDLHDLAFKEWEVETAKFDAVDAGHFEKAAILLQSQMKLENGHAADVLRLMRELVGEAASESRA